MMKNVLNISLIIVLGLALLFVSCSGGGSGGGSSPGPTPPADTTPPGEMTLEAYASVNKGEEARLRWVSSGDDNWQGSPAYFILRYSANPILTQDDWNNATDLASINATGPAGTQYDEHLPCPTGEWYFAIKAFDEANNEGLLSNSSNAAIKSKAQFYVDAWFPYGGSLFLNYDEAVAIIQGEGDIPSYVSQIATELMKCNPAYPGTQTDLENDLLALTNGSPGDSELHQGFDPWNLDNDAIGNPGVRLYFAPTGTSGWDFENLPDEAVANLKNTIKEFLTQYVEAHQKKYGNLEMTHNPTWATQD